MRRKSLWLSVALVILIGGGVLSIVILLTQHEPAFYARCEVPAGNERTNFAVQFGAKLFTLVQQIKNEGNRGPDKWNGQFTEEEINSCFAERLANKYLPEGVSEPRIAIEKDRIRLGFRYGQPPFTTIISVDFRVWLTQSQPNVVVLELQKLHAGSMPISAQSLLEDISGILRRNSIQVSWFRHDGNPTAVLKFQSDQPRTVSKLRQLDLKPGMLTIMGECSE